RCAARVRARAQAAEGEAAAGQRRPPRRAAAPGRLPARWRDARRKQGELKVIAALDRQFLNPLRINRGGRAGGGPVNCLRAVRYLHFLMRSRRSQGDVERGGASEREFYLRVEIRREILGFNAHLVIPDGQIGEMVNAFRIARDAACPIRGELAQADGRAVDDRPRSVTHCADERGGRRILPAGGWRCEKPY